MFNRFFPFLSWFKGYGSEQFKIDFVAGLTVALVLIPQSMAYAQLAGLPPYFGLYAAFLPPMTAALFGSSRQLATGPVAVVSLMTAASLEPLATAGSEGYIAYAILLALMVGVFQLMLGVLRLGIIVNLLSHPVVNGFTNAAAIIIATSQLSKLFGVYVDKAAHHYETIIRVVKAAAHYTHWPTLFMGAAAFAIMYGLKKTAPKIPNVLVAVALTTLISWGTGFENNKVVRIADIRSGAIASQVAAFNGSMEKIPQLSAERTVLMGRMDAAKKARSTFAVLDLTHALNVINTRIETLKHEAHIHRSGIRSSLLVRKTMAGGAAFYLPKEEGKAPAGAVWRIKVGGVPLSTDRLTLTGGGAVVGTIPRGLPALSMPEINFKAMAYLLPYAAIISLLGFMEAISIAKAMAAKTGQRLDPNQELIGQGIANILGAMGKSYPTSGSFSRSAVNLQAGALTGLSSVITSLTVIVVLLFFTPLLYHLPQSVLAAVIMMAVIGLINAAGFIHAWRAQWYDGAISIVSFLCTLAFAPHLDKGIMVGVFLSLAVFIYKNMHPTVSSLARHADEALRDTMTHQLKECSYVDLIRFEGALFFANATYLEDKINDRMEKKEKLKHIIIAANGINDMDASGEEALALVVDRVRSAGVDISFSGVNETVMALFRRTHLFEKIGEDHIYPTMESALCGVHESTHLEAQEDTCPLTNVCFLMEDEAE